MTSKVSSLSGKVALAVRRPHEDTRKLLQAGKYDDVLANLCGTLLTKSDDLVARELAFDAFTGLGDYSPALALAEDLLHRKPDVARYRKWVVFTLSNLKRFDEAIVHASRLLDERVDELAVLDVLKVACFYTGKIDDAVRYGQRGIELRDAAACSAAQAGKALPAPGRRLGRNVISYALWGTSPIYCYGAMINLMLARTAYPGWTCRFYVGADVPRACVDFLAKNGGEVIAIEKDYPGVGYFQRFLVMNDPSVACFLVRDCDARLSAEEAALTNEWRASGLPFHAIRDHVLHNDLINAGLWAGRGGTGIDIVALIREYFPNGPSATYGHDQRMLGSKLWPLIRGHALVHDKHYTLPGVRAVRLTDPKSHFGAGHRNVSHILQELDRYGIPRVL